eukprot:gene10046-9854_t
MADKKAQLIIEGAAPVELPILTGTVGPDVIDVRGLTATGRFTFDPGFMSTASCESKITYIDGDNGILLHRGYPIEQLAEKSDYLETCYLLLNGELPTAEQKAQFVGTVKNHTMVHEQLKTFFNGFRRDAHPMAVMCGVVGALSAFYHDSLDINNPQHREISAIRLVAKMPTLAAMFIAKAKDKNDPFKLMGFGHRVYKNRDPRATVMKQTCDEVLKELGIQNDPQLELAMRLEEIALTDPYFIERSLYPNVDFYSGIILKAIGIPTSMFTVIFALARTVGWISHWKEMLSSPYKIGRPRQLYTGYESRDITKLEDRK